MSKTTEIVVVGAGPVGLSAAVALAGAGVSVRIIDRLTVPTNQSRAAIVHARTLEHFERFGIVGDFIGAGVKVHEAAIYGHGNVLLVRPSFDYLATPFPFMIGLEQFKTEELLTRRLKQAGVEIERGVELVSFQESVDHVSLALRRADGSEMTAESAYLLGADGSHSAVRTGLGLRLEGETLDAVWLTADVKIRWDHDPSEMVAYLTEEGIAFIAAMNDDRWRVIVNVPGITKDQADKVTMEEIQTIVSERFGVTVSFYDPVWISAFGINTRMVPAMSRGRVFLAGDAAHVHSPVGGQGMNTGIQDAFNLAWKLALVLRGAAKPELLETYNAERHYNAKRLLSRIGRATRMANLRAPAAIEVRNRVLHLLGHLGIGRAVPQFISMLDVGYPESPAVSESQVAWLSRGPRAGERAPDAEGLLSADKTDPQRLFSLWSGDNRHQLLHFGNDTNDKVPSSPLYKMTRIVKDGTPSEGVVVDADAQAHEAYAVHRDGALYLVRPDGIIAFRSGQSDVTGLSEYLAKWFRT